MEAGIYSLTKLYLQLAASHEIFAFRHDEGFWADIGTEESLEVVREYFSKLKKED